MIRKLNLGLVLGDNTGVLHLQNTQKFYIEYNQYKLLRSSPPCSFLVDEGSELWASADFRLIGLGNPTLKLDGHLAGVMNLTLGQDKRVVISETASNSRLVAGTHVTLEQGSDAFSLLIFHKSRRYMAEILPIRRKTLSNQSVNLPQDIKAFQITRLFSILVCMQIATVFYGPSVFIYTIRLTNFEELP